MEIALESFEAIDDDAGIAAIVLDGGDVRLNLNVGGLSEGAPFIAWPHDVNGEMVIVLADDLADVSDVCRSFGISRKTGYKIYNRYKEHGLEALCDRCVSYCFI